LSSKFICSAKTKEGPLIDEAIAKLGEMGLKEGKSYKSGTLKLYFNPSNITNPTEKEKYVKNHLVQQYLEQKKISIDAHNILKNQSLEHVLSLINGKTLTMEKDGKEVGICLEGKDLKLYYGKEGFTLQKNDNKLGENLVNDIARMEWSKKDTKIQKQGLNSVNSGESKNIVKTNNVGIAYSNDMINLNTALYFANLPDKEIDDINQQIQNYEKFNPEDNKINEKVQEFIKPRAVRSSYL